MNDDKLTYTPDWNLATIPDEIFASEVGRRRGAQRKVKTGGRPAIPTPCPKCGMDCAGVVAARAHCKNTRPLAKDRIARHPADI